MVATTSSSAPAWGRVTVTTTRSGRSPDLLQHGPDDLAGRLAGHRVAGQGAGELHRAHPADGVNRMSSDRR